MSTDFFRRYLDLLNEATGQPPADFAPTHFHKNNLGFKIPLMQTPDGSFWWETTATSDDGGAVQRGGARKSIQPWVGNTENRSSLSGTASVDGVFKDGKAIEFPEGMTWKEYAASAEKSPQAALPAATSRQIEPELLAPLEPTDSGRKLVAPNTNVALPSSGTFSNDQALANLAAQMKDADSNISSTGNKIDSSESLYFLKQIKTLGDFVATLPDTIDPKAPDAMDQLALSATIITQFKDLFQEMAKLPENSVSGVTFQQVKDIYRSSVKKIQSRNSSFETRAQQLEKDLAASSKDSSGAASGSGSLPAGTQFAYVPGDGTSKDISGKKDSSGLPSAAAIGAGAAGAAASKKSGKETIITDSSHCEQCGTPKSIHAPLKHQFVPGDDVRPGPVGGSQSSSDTSTKPSSDTFDADVAARMAKIPAWDRAKNAPVGAPNKPLPPKPRSPGAALKEDIDRLPVADQMRAWQQLMEAPLVSVTPSGIRIKRSPSQTPDSGLTAAQQAAQRTGLGRPGAVGVGAKPDVRSLADKFKDIDQQRFGASPEIDRTPVGSTNSPARSTSTTTAAPTGSRDFTSIDRRGPRPPPPPPELPGWAQSRIQGRPTGTAASAQPMAARGIPGMDVSPAAPPTPPAAPADWKAKVKLAMKRIATPAAAIYSIYEGWQQISALPKDKMSRAQYSAEVTKIVARLVQENGIVLVSTTLGGLAGAPMGGVGAIPGMVAGFAGGLATEYYFGDDISKVVNGVVDYMYGTDKTPAPAPQQNKPTPAEVAENKAYLEGMTAWIAAGGIPDEPDKKAMDAAKAILKAAGVAVAPAPQAAEKVPVPAPAADPVAELVAELRSIETELDKLYSDQTPLPSKEAYNNEVKKLDRLVSAVSAATEKMAAKVDPDQKLPPELQTIANSVARKIHATQMTLLRRQALSDLDPDAYAKHKAAADKLTDLGLDINYLDVKDPDYLKKVAALEQQNDQILNNLPSIAVNDSAARMIRIQALSAVKDAMERKQKEYQDYRAKNPTPAPATGGPKEGERSTSKNGRPIIFKNGRWEYAN